MLPRKVDDILRESWDASASFKHSLQGGYPALLEVFCLMQGEPEAWGFDSHTRLSPGQPERSGCLQGRAYHAPMLRSLNRT